MIYNQSMMDIEPAHKQQLLKSSHLILPEPVNETKMSDNEAF